MKTTMDGRMKNFKKKHSNMPAQTTSTSVKASDKFSNLKQKLEKQKQTVQKTGRRFRQQASISTQEISIQTQPVHQSVSVEVSTVDTPLKQSMSLAQIQIKKQNPSQLKLSRVFQRQIQSQKKRTKQLWSFLHAIQLERFTDALIDSGFDDIDTLMEISTEDLNHLMMRASQQQRLMNEIKRRKGNVKDEPITPLSKNPSILRVKTETRPMTSQSSHFEQKSGRISETAFKKKQNKAENSSFMSSSFLMNLGGKNWSVEDQIRRACSGCFKVAPQLQKKGDCYYCQKCFSLVAGDLLSLSLDTSMSRSYKKY